MRTLGLAMLVLCIGALAARAGSVRGDEWQAYKAAFVSADGRVVDDANGDISHSEGQGYGMLLAVLAGAGADFEAIWGFTRTEMLIRDDGLIAWRWDPDARPHVTDLNNATDGDILVAYALARASEAWARPEYLEAATRLARAIGASTVAARDGRTFLLPAAEGFGPDARPDGPVVNLSYWVFEAMPVLARLDPSTDWRGIRAQGLRLIEKVRVGPRRLPPDWMSLAGRPRPADGFPVEFGYNGLRIPLYLLRAGNRDASTLRRLAAGMTAEGGAAATVDLATGERTVLADAGYRAIPALVACALDDVPLPPELRTLTPAHYYSATLHLLVLSYAREALPQCL